MVGLSKLIKGNKGGGGMVTRWENTAADRWLITYLGGAMGYSAYM
jgi:hypothetical protein